MDLQQRITALSALGKRIDAFLGDNENEKFESILRRTKVQNPWFDETNVRTALRGISHMLKEALLLKWADMYPALANIRTEKTAGAVLAGNLPLVGFHDMLCTLLAGYNSLGKLSSKDSILLPFLVNQLNEISPELGGSITLTDGIIKHFDVVVATGSDNSSRHFEYYFGKYPNIIRKNRGSVAVLTGQETPEQLQGLADDMLLYYGLGCRSISKLYVPEGFAPKDLYETMEKYNILLQHNKYLNNYEYNRALYLMNSIQHFDNGFCMLAPNEAISSPIGVIYYQEYQDIGTVAEALSKRKDEIQCIVSTQDIFYKPAIPFGQAQFPEVWDYADGVDTVQFLIENA